MHLAHPNDGLVPSSTGYTASTLTLGRDTETICTVPGRPTRPNGHREAEGLRLLDHPPLHQIAGVRHQHVPKPVHPPIGVRIRIARPSQQRQPQNVARTS
jgi:hypothetical protein